MAQDRRTTSTRPAVTRQAWEYLVVPVGASDETTFDAAGADGWELVAFYSPFGGFLSAAFKRPAA